MASGRESRIEDVASRYESTLRAWSLAATRLDQDGGVRDANRLFDQQRSLLKHLRADARGREFVAALVEDPDAGVRLMAASETLLWSADHARRVLAALAGDADAPPEHSFTAQVTLEEFDAGRLRFDW